MVRVRIITDKPSARQDFLAPFGLCLQDRTFLATASHRYTRGGSVSRA